ncbi:MAG: glycoside hydrolase family 36 protein [Candidatus Hermodarchaeota archaeon]
MSILINDNKNFIKISNRIISLTFYKNGKFAGTYEIAHNEDNGKKYFLKDCYCAINFLSENSNTVKEYCSRGINFDSKVEEINDQIGHGKKLILTNRAKELKIHFNIQFKIYQNQQFILIKIDDIVYHEEYQERVHSISPLTIKNSNLWLSGTKNSTKADKMSWFKQGWQSWSSCKLLFGNDRDDEGPKSDLFKRVYDNQDYKIKGRFYSEYCTVITDLETKSSLILGFITLNTQFTRILLNYEERDHIKLLSAFGCMDGVYLKNSSIKFSEELFICFKSENLGYYGLIDYAKLVKKKIDLDRIETIPIGWCSWYYYFTDVSEALVNRNLEFFQANKKKFPIDFFQLDDGYFTYIGDFNNINSKFLNGLAYLFKRINDSGLKGGIWTAPFFAERRANLYKQHRDWFLKDKNSNKMLKVHFNWNIFLYGLDLSNKQVLGYLYSFYRNLLYANKLNQKSDNHLINFFKIDFLHAAVPIDGNFSNQNLTRAQILHNGVKTIRDAITDHSFLLGCGAPLGPCVGLVDAMRIGEDTAPRWEETNKQLIESGIPTPALKISLINIIYRSFMHRNFWINDPDCLMIRRSDTDLKLDEIKLQLVIMGLSGGQILISDDMTKLSVEALNDAKLLIPPYNPVNYYPIVFDAFTSKLPTIYMLETDEIIGKRFLVALINWDDNFISKKLIINDLILKNAPNQKDFLIFDFWGRNYMGKYKGNQEIKFVAIPPHSCKFLSIIPVDNELLFNPILLSTSLHISQGCYEIKKYEYNNKEKILVIEIELIGKRKGSLYLKLPSGKQIVDSNSNFHIIKKKENIWELSIEFENKAIIKTRLS